MLFSDVESRSNFSLFRSREPPLASAPALDHLAAASAQPPHPTQADPPPVQEGAAGAPDAAVGVGGFVPYQPPAALAAMARIPTNLKQEPGTQHEQLLQAETIVKRELESDSCALYLHHPLE